MQNFIGTYGYLAIFILMAAESACIPIPSRAPIGRHEDADGAERTVAGYRSGQRKAG